jgi:hypothetical protein
VPKELNLQRDIKKSAIRDGGSGFKLSNRFSVGIPDLHLSLPSFAPCIVEVKDLGECVPSFDRQLDVTPKQRHTMNQLNAPYAPIGPVSFLLVGLTWQKERFLVVLPAHTERLSAHQLQGPLRAGSMVTGRATGGYYGLRPLWDAIGVPRVVSSGPGVSI